MAILNKALDKNRNLNHILKSIIHLIFLYLYITFYTCSIINYYLIYFYFSITNNIQKSERLNNIIAKICWLIAILNIFGKAFKFIITNQIIYFAKTYHFLHQNHFNA